MDKWVNGRLVLILFIMTQAVYLVMVIVTLSHLRTLSSGSDPFDMMPAGYDLTYAVSFLQAIGEQGRSYYLTRQIPLDLLYPGLFAVSYGAMWLWLFAKLSVSRDTFRGIALIPVVVGLTDYAENASIVGMLKTFPQMPETLVSGASALTVAKSAGTLLFFLALVVLLGVLGIQKLKRSSR